MAARFAVERGTSTTDHPPYDQALKPYRDGLPVFVEITEEQMWTALEVLPPIYFRGGFAVSEPQCHDRTNTPVYACVVTKGKRYFLRYGTVKEAEAFADELRSGAVPEVPLP
jgi:hypothetical protein